MKTWFIVPALLCLATVLIFGKRLLIDLPTVLIAITTTALFFKHKKNSEAFIILAAADLNILLKGALQ